MQLLHSYQQLPASLYSRATPKRFANPRVLLANHDLASTLHIDPHWLNSDAALQILSGQAILENSQPIAQAYAGHQFGHFTVLGDGRAIVLGEYQLPDQSLIDIQLKGCGPTVYSRRGDGLATLGSMIREYIYSEAMHSLGVPSSRSLALICTGELVYRERPYPGAVLTRVAKSHIRIGTFEFARLTGIEELKALTNYTIHRHYPDLLNDKNTVLSFLERVIDRQAQLVAQWMSLGFIHGVMNTDNISICGETIDYGPCAFLDEYDPKAVFSSIDRQGRYAYGAQPGIMHWNLCRFAETLLPLIDPEHPEQSINKAQDILSNFQRRFESYRAIYFCKKIGFTNPNPIAQQLVNDLLHLMESCQLDFTQTFRSFIEEDAHHPALRDWLSRWKQSLKDQQIDVERAQELMRQCNPVIIPRNYVLVKAIEEAEAGDTTHLRKLLNGLNEPYSEYNKHHPWAQPKPIDVPRTTTYCGT